MQTGNLGAMRFTFQGEWKPQVYTMNSAVRYGNSTYIAVRNVEAGDIPGKSNGWGLSLHGDTATTDLMGMGYVARESEISSGKTDEDRNGGAAFMTPEGVRSAIFKHPVTTETWRSVDGLGWYRKWSDGFIEQGGWVGSSGQFTKVNLMTPFQMVPYSVVLSLGVPSGSYPSHELVTCVTDSQSAISFNLAAKTTTATETYPMYWMARGY